MEILAHRGVWHSIEEQNSLKAFERAIELGVGIETDLRFQSENIVISHDPPESHSTKFEELLDLAVGTNTLLALNAKTDGLANSVKQLTSKYGLTRFFGFDMAVPDLLSWLHEGLPVFARVSEYEDFPSELSKLGTRGIWLDSFHGDWFQKTNLLELLEHGQPICVVSPELHGRNYERIWFELRQISSHVGEQLKICTDYPVKALEFFSD